MSCVECKDLSRAFERTHASYVAAYSAPFYKISPEIAAKKQVDMERAKNDLQEHQLACPAAQESAYVLCH
jgi:hypothetical protein